MARRKFKDDSDYGESLPDQYHEKVADVDLRRPVIEYS